MATVDASEFHCDQRNDSGRKSLQGQSDCFFNREETAGGTNGYRYRDERGADGAHPYGGTGQDSGVSRKLIGCTGSKEGRDTTASKLLPSSPPHEFPAGSKPESD